MRIARFVSAFALLGASGLQAGTVAGRVTDPSGAPLAGVRVAEPGSSSAAWTDADGRYRLAGRPAGETMLEFLSTDYIPVERTVAVPPDGEVELDAQFQELRVVSTNIEVIGVADEALRDIPGSAFSITREELTRSMPMDSLEVLRRVPGVHVVENSGPVGTRLNMGIRGLNPDRSRQVLVLEDGLPIALAPYGEPELYYAPQIDRMERVEVLKGSGQIVHGPQTVGGVVNFVTPDPPQRFHGDVNLEGGQRGLFFGNASVGGATRGQRAGWLANYLHKQGDGWRGFYYDLDDVQSKIVLKPDDNHTISFKTGFYDERSNSTYLGLTLPMYLQDPNQNPVTGDLLFVRRFSGSVAHSYALSPNALWSTTAFAYTTRRDWMRADFDRADAGRDYAGVFGDRSVPGGALFIRNSSGGRNRSFNVAGAQTGVSAEHSLFGVRNKLDAGIRYVYEDMNDKFIVGESFRSLTGAIRDDENRFGRAFAAYLQNRFTFGRVSVTPGIRLEQLDQERHILRARVNNVPTNVDIRNNNPVTKAIPGLGLSYRVTDRFSFFTGIHRGFAPPTTKVAITAAGENLDLGPELSWNLEAGVRYTGARAIRAEFTWFRMDFQNQIIPAAQSGGAVTTLTNGGETLHAGVEASFRVNWDDVVDLGGWSVYTDVRHTHLATAKFTRNLLFGGNRLPYAPENTFGFLVGARQRQGFGFQLDLNTVGAQFADNRMTVPISMDGTIGRLQAYEIFNLLADYTVRRERFEVRPYFTVKNAFDRRYIASLAPQGIQPGMFRQANVGMKFSF